MGKELAFITGLKLRFFCSQLIPGGCIGW